jgi:competence ComEA-like helix-hairpin-helix protein
MRVSEGQRMGAIVFLLSSLAVYGASLFYNQRPFNELCLPWGDQGQGMIAVEVAASRVADGIYFFPEGTELLKIIHLTGIDGKIEPSRTDQKYFSDHAAITISPEGGALKVTDMPAIRRLALGLPIDINRASAEELSQVPGIGETTAAKIVRQRESRGKFETLSELTTIPGIKDKKLNSLKKYLMVGSIP